MPLKKVKKVSNLSSSLSMTYWMHCTFVLYSLFFLLTLNYIWRPLWLKSTGSCLFLHDLLKYESKMSWLVCYQMCGLITYSISHRCVHFMTHKVTFTLTWQKSLQWFSIIILIKLLGAWNNRFHWHYVSSWLSPWRQPCI